MQIATKEKVKNQSFKILPKLKKVFRSYQTEKKKKLKLYQSLT